MKKEKINTPKKLSANEINRFIYCPYQWYYGRYYGQTELKTRYKALGNKGSKVENNFSKGIKFHKAYYRKYRIRRILIAILLVLSMILVLGSINQWFK